MSNRQNKVRQYAFFINFVGNRQNTFPQMFSSYTKHTERLQFRKRVATTVCTWSLLSVSLNAIADKRTGVRALARKRAERQEILFIAYERYMN